MNRRSGSLRSPGFAGPQLACTPRARILMNWTDLFSALGLMLVIEGIMPFASPASWRKMMQQVASSPDTSLRGIGA